VTTNVTEVEALSLVSFKSPSGPASSTTTVIEAVPDWFGSGVKEIEPLEAADV
jgi:hypothetical protein